MITLYYVTCSKINPRFIYHSFLAVAFGSSPKWHGLLDVRRIGRMTFEVQWENSRTPAKASLMGVLWEW